MFKCPVTGNEELLGMKFFSLLIEDRDLCIFAKAFYILKKGQKCTMHTSSQPITILRTE